MMLRVNLWVLLIMCALASRVLVAEPPSWVDARPQRVNGEYQIPIHVGPYATVIECESNLHPIVQATIDDYVEQLIGPKARGHVRLPWSYVEQNVIRERFQETRLFQLTSSQQSEMVTLHLLLSFNQETNALIRQLWRQVVGLQRLKNIGLGLLSTVWIMAVVWGYLQLDLRTQGRYRWRLRTAAVILLATPFLAAGFFVIW